jgi:type II secretory pathway component PulM
MRILRALRDFFSDLGQRDPVALALAGFVLLLAVVLAAIWIIDLRRRKKENKGKKPRPKERPRSINKPKG